MSRSVLESRFAHHLISLVKYPRRRAREGGETALSHHDGSLAFGERQVVFDHRREFVRKNLLEEKLKR